MASYEEFQAKVDDLTFKVEDLLRWAQGLTDVAQSGELGALAFVEALANAPVGDQSAVRNNLGLGPAATRGVTGGSGDLMAQGAFGLGRNSHTYNDTTLSGALGTSGAINQIFSFNASDFSEVGLPSNTSMGGWVVNRGARPVAFLFPNAQRLYATRFNGDVWQPVVEFIRREDILGEVSQSSGFPTGAIIEVGENNSGWYCKFSGGLLISVALDFEPDWGDSIYQSVPLPYSLSSPGAAFVSGASTGNTSLNILRDCVTNITSNGDVRITLRGDINGDLTNTINVVAIGLWS